MARRSQVRRGGHHQFSPPNYWDHPHLCPLGDRVHSGLPLHRLGDRPQGNRLTLPRQRHKVLASLPCLLPIKAWF